MIKIVRTARYSKYLLALIPAIVNANVPGVAPSEPYSIDGYLKYTSAYTTYDNKDSNVDHLLTLRLNAEYQLNDHWLFNSSIRNQLKYINSESNNQYSTSLNESNDYFDLSHNWIEKNNRIGSSDFDRFYLDWSDQDYLVRIGRFRVNWGMTTIWNPNDIFNAYSLYETDYPERPGTDALYITKTLNYASELNWVYSPNKNRKLDGYSIRYLFNTFNWDGQTIFSYTQLNTVVGLGFSGDVKGAAIRGESSWFEPNQSSWTNDDGQTEYLERATVSSVEASYSFSGQGNWTTTGAVLHMSNPYSTTEMMNSIGTATSVRSLSFTEFTVYFDIGFDWTPLHRMTFMSSYYQDDSFFYGFSSNYSVSNNASLTIVLQRFDGRSNSVFGKEANTYVSANINLAF